MTETVRAFSEYGPQFFPLPHPSWRSVVWMRKVSVVLEETVIPSLRRESVRNVDPRLRLLPGVARSSLVVVLAPLSWIIIGFKVGMSVAFLGIWFVDRG